jgi:hypothetical protein
LDDELVRLAKAEAAQQGKTLDALVEQALRDKLRQAAPRKLSARNVLPTHDLGGPKPGVSFDDGRALRNLLDQDGIARC